jgi:hypothetical protein
MSVVVRVDEHFSSEHLGNALARLWAVHGLTLDLIDVMDMHDGISGDVCICTFTTERPTNPGMTEDGQVYSMGNITQWLDTKKHERDPNP